MSEKNVPDEVVQHFLNTFYRFHRVFLDENKRQGPYFEPHGKKGEACRIKHSEQMLMLAIAEAQKEHPDGVNVSELSRLMRVKPPSITAPLNDLEARGFVQRAQDANDRRIVRVHITEDGHDFLIKSRDHLYARVRDLMEYLGADKAGQLVDIMDDVFVYFQSQKEKRSDNHA